MSSERIYLEKIKEVIDRLCAAQLYFEEYKNTNISHLFDSSILQTRKALECVAFAAIAPNETQYKCFREKAEGNKDYRKDFNGSKILKALEKINSEFYPIPLLPFPKLETDQSEKRHWHFENKETGFLTRKKFESIYDRLGKYLHADNPWGNDKSIENLEKDIPVSIDEIYTLIELHRIRIISEKFNGVWIVEASKNGKYPSIITAKLC